jgi:phytoene dehydrogenase-like protein
MGVTVETSTEVRRVLLDASGCVAGVEVVGDVVGDVVRRCDVVVANADARHLYADLLPDRSALRRVERADLSTSGFVVLVGARGTTPGIAHHNVWFSDDSRAEFAELEAGRVAPQPTVYACVSSVTDPSQAPPGCENWFLLVNVPAGARLDADRETDRVLGRLAEFGIDLADRAEVVATRTPADIAERYRTEGGAIYGTSSNGRRAAFVRPRNRGARRGLYLVGGSSHPGGGLPLVTMSGRIVADMIAADGWS